MRSIVWASDRVAELLRQRVSGDIKSVRSLEEFLAADRNASTVSFVDDTTVGQLVGQPVQGAVIAVCQESLKAAVGWLATHAWLDHVVSTSTLQQALSSAQLQNVMTTLTNTDKPKLLDWIPDLTGRRVRLTHASKRVERLERMAEFFVSKGVGDRTIQLMRDIGEELLTNAFYDAPVAAGAVSKAISRTQDVSLPEDGACDMVYGCRDDLAVVRVRDPFGSLKRPRLVEVLARCARTDMGVQVDETMGGAGLGLWRIFSVATMVAITVIDHRHTEFLVAIGKRPPGTRPFSFHLFFRDTTRKRFWRLFEDDTGVLKANQSDRS